jgi:hypothetical protein
MTNPSFQEMVERYASLRNEQVHQVRRLNKTRQALLEKFPHEHDQINRDYIERQESLTAFHLSQLNMVEDPVEDHVQRLQEEDVRSQQQELKLAEEAVRVRREQQLHRERLQEGIELLLAAPRLTVEDLRREQSLSKQQLQEVEIWFRQQELKVEEEEVRMRRRERQLRQEQLQQEETERQEMAERLEQQLQQGKTELLEQQIRRDEVEFRRQQLQEKETEREEMAENLEQQLHREEAESHWKQLQEDETDRRELVEHLLHLLQEELAESSKARETAAANQQRQGPSAGSHGTSS